MTDDSPFAARAFISGKGAVTLATDIPTLDQEQFSAVFRKSPMKRAKLVGLRRNAAVMLQNDRKLREVTPVCWCESAGRSFTGNEHAFLNERPIVDAGITPPEEYRAILTS